MAAASKSLTNMASNLPLNQAPQPMASGNAPAPIQMTRAQYQAAYGTAPSTATTPAVPAPVQMTREQYQQTYGSTPNVPALNPATQGFQQASQSVGNASSLYKSGLLKTYAGAIGLNSDTGQWEMPDALKEAGSSKSSNPFVAVGEGALRSGASLLNVVFAPLTQAISSISQAATDDPNVQSAASGALSKLSDAGQAIESVRAAHPEAAKDIDSAMAFLLTAAGGEGMDKDFSKVFPEKPQYIGKTTPIEAPVPPSEGTPSAVEPTDAGPSQEEIDQAKSRVANAYQSSMPLTPLEQVKEANLLKSTGGNVYTTLAKYNISPASDDAAAQLDSLSDQFRAATDQAKENEGAYFNLDEIKKNAEASILDNLSSATERQSATAKLSDEIDALRAENKGNFIKNSKGEEVVPSKIVERLRKTGNDWAKYGKNKFNPDSVKEQTGRALGNAVRDQVEKEGTFPAYREASREWSKVIHAQEVLQKISDSGKQFKVIGGFGGTIARRVLSGLLGFHTGGVGGAILTELGSEAASKILSNPDFRTYFDRQLLTKASDGKITPAEVKSLADQVKAFIQKQESVPRLGGGKTIFAEVPKGQESDLPVTRDAKAISVKNPKTGKYEKAYTSEPKLSDELIREKYDWDAKAKKYIPKKK